MNRADADLALRDDGAVCPAAVPSEPSAAVRGQTKHAVSSGRRRLVVGELRAITLGGGAVGPGVRSVRRGGFSCS